MSRGLFRFGIGFALVLCARLAAAADVPTKEEWQPVETALTRNDDKAEALLKNIVGRYPRWTDGFYEMARWQLKNGQAQDALTSSWQALKLNPMHSNAASIAAQAMIQLGKHGDAVRLADGFAASKDPKASWVHFYAASAAYQQHDYAKAEASLRKARDLCGSVTPAPFHFLDGRLAEHAQPPDLPRAEASFNRALVSDDKNWDAWYELGRVQTAMAEQGDAKAEDYLKKAQDAFERVTKALPNDFESWLGLGRCQLNQAKIADDRGDQDAAAQFLHLAEGSLKEALLQDDQLAAAHVCLGETLLRQGKADDAIVHLKRANELGVKDRDVDFNLAIALENAGRNAEAEEIFRTTKAISPSEKIAAAMNHYRGRRYEHAERLLSMTLDSPEVTGDNDLHAAVLRYIGHSWREWGKLADKQLETADNAALAAERDRRWDEAAKAYREAGNLSDAVSRDHLLALEAARDPARAYRAGWTYLDWNGYWSPSGWKTVLANYGSSKAWNNTTHQAAWGAAFGLIFILWIRSLFHRRPKTTRIYPNANKPLPPPTNLVPKSARQSGHDSGLAPSSTTKKIRGALEPKKSSGEHQRPPTPRPAGRANEKAETSLYDPRRPPRR